MEQHVTTEIRNICRSIQSQRHASATLALNVFIGGTFIVLVATLLAYRWKPYKLRKRYTKRRYRKFSRTLNAGIVGLS